MSSTLTYASAAYDQALIDAARYCGSLSDLPLPAVPVSISLRCLADLIVAQGLGTLARQLTGILTAVEGLSSGNGKSTIEVELLVADSGLPAFGRFLDHCGRAIRVKHGAKEPHLMETYRFSVVVDVVSIPDIELFRTNTAILALSLFDEAQRKLALVAAAGQALKGGRKVI